MMDKRTFLKQSAIAGLGVLLVPDLIAGGMQSQTDYTLPPLPYVTDALEPFIDKQTMELHHDKHHAAYVSKLNDALKGKPEAGMPLEQLMAQISKQPVAVRNNGGGHYNHSLFWTLLAAGKNDPEVHGKTLAEAIKKTFGSIGAFKEAFAKAATGQFGSGWAWLNWDNQKKELFISATPNQDNPLMDLEGIRRGTPLIALDVWEHAYYLKYQNKRADYINAFWSVLNWEKAAQLFMLAKA